VSVKKAPAPHKSGQKRRPVPPTHATRARSDLRRQMFVSAYLTHHNATQAARAAGYGPSCAAAEGCRMLKDGRVQEMLQQASLASVSAAQVRASDILTALMEIAYSDPAQYFTAVPGKDGVWRASVRQVAEMPLAVRRTIASMKVKRGIVGDDEIEIRCWPKVTALTALAQHLGLLKTVVEHQVTIATLEKLPDEELMRAHREEIERYERHIAARAKLRGLPAAQVTK